MVLARVVLKPLRSVALVTEVNLVDERDSALPVAGEQVRGRSVDLILAAHKVPHEVPPVHPAKLEIEEICQIGPLRRLLVLRPRHRSTLAVSVGFVELDVPVINAVHPREQHLSGTVILEIYRSRDTLVLPVQRSPIGFPFDIVRSAVVLAVEQRSRAVLLTGEITDKGEGVVRLVLVGRGLGAGADDHDAEHREADHDRREAQQGRVPEHFLCLQGLEKPPEACGQQSHEEERRSGVVRKPQRVHEEQVEIGGYLRDVRHHEEQDEGEDHHRDGEDLDIFPE